jgi:anti-sigma factor RsiW
VGSYEGGMTCADVAQLLDPFVDAELPAPMLLAVARHAGGCPACDAAVRDLTALHEAVERVTMEDSASLDLSHLWPGIERAADRIDTRRVWMRRLRTTPLWGIGLAAAASALFWLTATPEPVRIAERPARPNQVAIERLDSDGARFELRRERKNGTTLIMVSGNGAEVVP